MIVVDEARRTVRANGREVTPTKREFQLILLLERRPGVVRTWRELMDAAGMSLDSPYPTLKSHMRRARMKLSQLGVDPIRTRRGVGFFWDANHAANRPRLYRWERDAFAKIRKRPPEEWSIYLQNLSGGGYSRHTADAAADILVKVCEAVLADKMPKARAGTPG